MPDFDILDPRMARLALDYDPLKLDTRIKDDPFWGAYTQTHRMRAYCKVIVDGIDITDKIEPHLISVRIVDGDQFQCEIELDDRDAMLPIPPILSTVTVELGWARESMYKMFTGWILDLEHGFGRKQGGRRMWIHANGWNTLATKMKEPMQANMGEGAPPGEKEGKKHSLVDWVQKIASLGGGKANVAGHFAANMQDYWGMMSASPIHEITSLGEKFGAMTQMGADNTIQFEKPGQRGVSCRAVWRDNLIGWRVRPFQSRSNWKDFASQHFDKNFGEWITKKLGRTMSGTGQGPDAKAEATGGAPGPEATPSGASGANQGASSGQDSAYLGTGRIVINGEPLARWNSYVMLQGARPGVDGTYLIHVAEHIYSRQGYVTWLDVVPYGKALGADNVLGNWPLPRPNPNIGR